MKFKVTGGTDGVSGIEFGNKRYEAGETVEMTAKQAEWLVDQGYLESPDAPKVPRTPVVEPEPVVEPAPVEAPATESSPTVEGEA